MTDQPTTPAQGAMKPATLAHVIADMMVAAGEPRPHGDILAAVLAKVLPGIPAPAPAEQEPVAWCEMYKSGRIASVRLSRDQWRTVPLYAHPAPVPTVPDDVAHWKAVASTWQRHHREAEMRALAAEAQVARLSQERDEALGKAALNEEWSVESELESARLHRDRDRLTEELAQVKGLLEKAREWNWIDFEEAKKAGDKVDAFLPDLCRLDAEITTALAQPADDSHGEDRT